MTTTTILLFGETGNGKSTLGNQLLGENAFKVSDDTKSETKITYGRKGTGDWSDFFVIDTPGLQDTELAVKEHIQLVRYVKEHKKLNAIFIVFNYQQVRLSNNIKTMIKLFCNIFPMKDVGKHIGLVFTNSFTKRGVLTNEQKLSKENKVLPEFRRVIKEVSGSDLATNIPTVFVDIDPEEGIDENGKKDLERIKAWASFLPNLNVEEMKTPDSQDFNEIKIDGKKEKEQRRKYLEQKLLEIKNASKNSKEDKEGECSEGKNEFKAGVTDEDELVKEANLSNDESTLSGEWIFASNLSKTLEKTFAGKTIVGWKLKSNRDDGKGGFWKRNSEVLGTSSYSFFVSSFKTRGCDWKLRIWVVDNNLPFDI